MRISIDKELLSDLSKLSEIIKGCKEAFINDNQEIIFVTLKLLINPTFRNEIKKLREKHNIPKEWKSKDKDKDESEIFNEWVDIQPTNPPQWYDYPEILEVCRLCDVNPKMYGEFVLSYLYSSSISISKPDPHIFRMLKDEHRYRTRLEVDYGNDSDMLPEPYTPFPQKVSLRIFQDTTKTRLINYIEDNWHEIERMKKLTKPYPHTKNYKSFKRDILVYLEYLQGKEPSEIGKDFLEIETYNLTEFALDNNDIHQIISDFNKRLSISNNS